MTVRTAASHGACRDALQWLRQGTQIMLKICGRFSSLNLRKAVLASRGAPDLPVS
jgi:hypothetical protein